MTRNAAYYYLSLLFKTVVTEDEYCTRYPRKKGNRMILSGLALRIWLESMRNDI